MKVKLKDICEIQSGGTPNRSNKQYWDNGTINWAKISDIKDKYLFNTEEKITEEGLKNSSAKLFKKNSILYTIFATLGEACILGIDTTTNQAIANLEIRDKNVETEYIYYYLLSKKKLISGIGRGVAQNNINLSILKEMEINLADITTQKRIVDILNQNESIINKYKKQIALLDTLIKARFVEMFGDIDDVKKWERKKWQEVVEIRNGKDYKKVLVKKGGYPVYGTGGEMARASEYLCPENTIVVGRKGSINNPLLVKEKFWNVDTAFGVVAKKELNYQYLYQFCKSFNFMKLNKATTLPSTTKEDLLKIEINLPPIDLQNQFATFVKHIDKLKVA